MSSPAHPDDMLQKIPGPHGRWKTTTLGGLSNEAPLFCESSMVQTSCIVFWEEGSTGKSFALGVALVGHGAVLSAGRFAVVLGPSKRYWKARQKSSPVLAVSDLGFYLEEAASHASGIFSAKTCPAYRKSAGALVLRRCWR